MNRRRFLAGLAAVGAAVVLPINWVRKRFRFTIKKGKVVIKAGEAATLQEIFDEVPEYIDEPVVVRWEDS